MTVISTLTSEAEARGGGVGENKILVYITGCGRSGSTIMGFCIGNSTDAIDLGEVIDYSGRSGIPNGFNSETETFKFWQKIRTSLSESPDWVGLETFTKLQRRFDRHVMFLPILFFGRLLNGFGLAEYRNSLKLFYDTIFESSNHRFYIDSSKYPSRLLHLTALYPSNKVFAIHLIRDPAAVAESFGRDVQSPKSIASAMLYFLVINGFVKVLFWRLRLINCISVQYERFIEAPEVFLRELGAMLQMDVGPAVTKIEKKLPLKCGFPMNGNRMRRQAEIVIQTGLKERPNHRYSDLRTVKILRRLFL